AGAGRGVAVRLAHLPRRPPGLRRGPAGRPGGPPARLGEGGRGPPRHGVDRRVRQGQPHALLRHPHRRLSPLRRGGRGQGRGPAPPARAPPPLGGLRDTCGSPGTYHRHGCSAPAVSPMRVVWTGSAGGGVPSSVSHTPRSPVTRSAPSKLPS